MLNGHVQVYIGGRNNDQRHERHGPEVTPERLLKLESFLPSEELKICLQITAHDKHLHVTETGAIFTDMSLLMSGAMFAARKCSRQHTTQEAKGEQMGRPLQLVLTDVFGTFHIALRM